jgi:phenylalanyl-tRNA synthetase beta chain
MKASLKWIREIHPSLKATPQAIEKRLTGVGIEVEALSFQAEALEQVVSAEVRKVEKHPDADSLSLTEVFDGVSIYKVVCGAPNVAEGQKVAFAKIGAHLPTGVTIERRKIRGVESEGMICSEAELGLSDVADGILVLGKKTKLGKPIAEVLGLDDVVLEVAPTPNRPDCLSHFGLARELSAIQGVSLPKASARVREAKESASSRAKIRIEDAKRCPKYVGRVILGVKVGPSPEWLVRRLRTVGQRSISNVVDATNLVLLELGHPLHAFDLDKLQNHEIVVRTAREGESIITIDGVERRLDTDDLVIADASAPVALAGVMGGRDSSVIDTSTNLLLEAALFDPKSVRRTSRRHALHTDASHRFERGADPAMIEVAMDRVADLIVDLAGGKVSQGKLVVGKRPDDPAIVPIRPSRATLVLGRSVDKNEARKTLTRLGLKPVLKAKVAKAAKNVAKKSAQGKGKKPDMKDALWFEVPSWRIDLSREEDLIEEVARMGGFDSIPTVMPPVQKAVIDAAPERDFEREVKDHLASEGFLEAISLAFNSRPQVEPFGIDLEDAVEVANPLGEESALMRMSLVPALLRAARLNQDVLPSITDLRLFELGRTFAWSRPPQKLPVETAHAAIVMRGHRVPASWATKDHKGVVPMLDAYDVKAVVEGVLARFRVEAPSFERHEASWLHPRSATRVELGGRTLGIFGELHPDVMPRFGLEGPPIFVADLLLEAIKASARGHATMRPLPKQPPARRDLSFFIAREISVARILQTIRSAAARHQLEDVEVFDVYEGENLPEGKRSVAVAMIFRAQDRTLTDAEVKAAEGAIIGALSGHLQAEIRSA